MTPLPEIDRPSDPRPARCAALAALLPAALLAPAAFLALAACADPKPPPPPESTDVGRTFEVAFQGGLESGWSDWGWCPRKLDEGKPARLVLADKAGWILARPGLEGAYDLVALRLKPPSREDARALALSVGGPGFDGEEVKLEERHLSAAGDGWLHVRVAVDELGGAGRVVERVRLRAFRDVAAEPFFVDDVRLRRVQEAAPGALPKKGASLAVDCRGERRPISPFVYGVAFDPQKANDPTVWELAPTIRRFGGNPTSRFNWRLGNAWNTGSDWFFENVNYTGDRRWHWSKLLDENLRRGATTALTVPLLGWVAKDTTSSSFPVSLLGPQRAHDPWRSDAGDGHRADGTPLPPPPPTTTSVRSGPEDVEAWVREIRRLDEARGERSVAVYHLDNEPTLWSTTHRDVHPEPVGYDEILEKTIAYGSAVRRADPDAFIAGIAAWGWTSYFWSAKDQQAGRFWRFLRPDRRAHGDRPLLEWLLASVRAHEEKTGVRILDALDVHFYPQAPFVYGHGGAERSDPATARSRVRSTRALWDEGYVDESWIDEPVMLLPRMRRIIEENAPGLKLVVGEYAFGGEQHVSGGLAQAEALGRFGQAGVHAAFTWTYPKKGTPAATAFRAFRDFDGEGGRFLDFSLPVKMDDEVSLFASTNEEGTKLVAVLLNLSFDVDREARIDLQGCGAPSQVRAFRSVDGMTALSPLLLPSTDAVLLPAASITVVEWSLPRGGDEP